MKKCTCFCNGWWPFIIFPFLLLLLTLLFKWRDIEQDVSNNVQTELSALGYQNVGIKTHDRGRDVLLKGAGADRAEIEQIALKSTGVRTVDFVANEPAKETVAKIIETTPEPVQLTPAKLLVSYESSNVVLSGVVQSNDISESLFADAVASYGKGNVINNLQVSETTSLLPNLNGLFDLGTEFNDGDQISIEADNLTLTGDVKDQGTKDSVYSSVSKLFNGTVINQLIVSQPVVADAPVNSVKCQQLLSGLLAEQTINFSTGKAIIRNDSFPLLDKLVSTAKRCPDTHFEISGHTDSSGSLALNMSLSQQRATVVMGYMTHAGLAAERFTANGYGPTKPIANNETVSGRAKNRRIEFSIKKLGD